MKFNYKLSGEESPIKVRLYRLAGDIILEMSNGDEAVKILSITESGHLIRYHNIPDGFVVRESRLLRVLEEDADRVLEEDAN
jgi:hypothetical protein